MFDAAFRTITYEFRVRTALADVADRLKEVLAPFRVEPNSRVPTFEIVGPAPDSLYRVLLDGELVQRSDSTASAFDYVLWRASKETIERATRFLVLHAGAVSWRGRAVVLPAPPESGKTTLTAGLTRAGFRYLTDEAAFIELGTGRLHPFPRALSMESGTMELMPDLRRTLPAFASGPRVSYHVDPSDLGRGAIGAACRVRYVVAPRYVRGARTALEPLSRAEAVVLLARNSFNAAGVGEQGIRLLADLVQRADCYRLVMGDLDAAVDAVSGLVKEGNPRV